jgi:predicted aspartyl protease
MSVSEIKKELSTLNVSFMDLFEKEGLVKRLDEARRRPAQPQPDIKIKTTKTPTSGMPSNVLQVPLYFTSLDSDVRIAAVNLKDVGGGITIQPGEQPYPTIQIEVPNPSQPTESFTLTLLLDTACSGFVLRPEVVQRHKLPSYSTPVTMIGAGGVSGKTGLTQLDTFTLGDASFGPLPAAVQDIGALPSKLDGIIGLSFFSQFVGIEMDFCKGVVSFYRDSLPLQDSSRTVLAQADMELVPRLGIYTCQVSLGGRGPVNMLVDTGASSTFLNWKGIEQLGLERTSPALSRIRVDTGAMGSDNMAIELTHRIGVSSTLNLGRSSGYPGLSLQDAARLQIDIGQIPILDSLKDQGVGGILGIDALMRCATVRMTFKGRKSLTLFN